MAEREFVKSLSSLVLKEKSRLNLMETLPRVETTISGVRVVFALEGDSYKIESVSEEFSNIWDIAHPDHLSKEEVEKIVDEVVAKFPEAERGLLVGQCMLAAKGKAKPNLINEILDEKLNP